MKARVPITKNRLRTRVRNSRLATSSTVRNASLRIRPGSSSGSNAVLRHRFAEDVQQRRHVAAELADWSGRERGLQHGLVTRCAIQLDQPARAVIPHHLHAAERVGPTGARRRSIDPEPVRTARTQLVDGPAGDQVSTLNDPDQVADALNELELVAGEDD